LAKEAGPSATSSRWPIVVSVVIVAWMVAVVVTLGRPFTDHVPVAPVPPPRTTTPFVYRCAAPLGGADVELRRGPAPDEATPARRGCAAPRSTRRALAGVDLALTVIVVAALGTLAWRRRAAASSR
jgi:hypothetical protein